MLNGGYLQNIGQNPPYQETFTQTLTRLDQPVPTGVTVTAAAALTALSVRAIDPHWKDPYMQTWSLDVQHQFGKEGKTLVDIGYFGSKGTHLPGPNQVLNQLPVEFLSQGASLLTQVPNPFLGQVQLGALAQPNVARAQLLRPYPQYTGYNLVAPMNRNSVYHSAQVKVEKRFAQGASMLISYTWAKLISDTDTLTAWLEPGGGLGVQNWYNLHAERSVTLYDVPHRAVMSFIYDLPFGKGKKFMNGTNGGVSRLVGGWGINGITTFQSGNPLNMTMAVNTTNSQGGGQRPNVVAGQDFLHHGRLLPTPWLRIHLPAGAWSRGTPLTTADGTLAGLLAGGVPGVPEAARILPAAAVRHFVTLWTQHHTLARAELGIRLRHTDAIPRIEECYAALPAERAGIHPGDILLKIAATETPDSITAAAACFYLRVDEPVKIQVLRDMEIVEVTATPVSATQRQQAARPK